MASIMEKIGEVTGVAGSGESRTVVMVIALTLIGALVLALFAVFKTYPPSAFLATLTAMAGAVLLIPLILRLARE